MLALIWFLLIKGALAQSLMLTLSQSTCGPLFTFKGFLVRILLEHRLHVLSNDKKRTAHKEVKLSFVLTEQETGMEKGDTWSLA